MLSLVSNYSRYHNSAALFLKSWNDLMFTFNADNFVIFNLASRFTSTFSQHAKFERDLRDGSHVT